MASRRRWIGITIAFIVMLSFAMNGCGEKKSADSVAVGQAKKEYASPAPQTLQDSGFPIYPSAVQDPENPPIHAPQMTNIHLLTNDPFNKVVEWYTQELGPFDVEQQEKGSQALWSKEMEGGMVMTSTISTIIAPPGKVAIVLTKGRFGK